MFKNIYLDRRENTFKLWTTDGKVISSEFSCRSWQEKESQVDAPYKTIYGVPVVPVFRSAYEEREDIKSGRMRHEIDIQPEIRILSEYYQKEENLTFKMDQYNIGYIDIEVVNGKGFPEPADAPREINLISIYTTKYKKYKVFGTKPVDEVRLHELLKERNGYYNEVKKIYNKFGDLKLHENYEYVYCSSEYELLMNFFEYCSQVKCDIFSGWNCISENSSVWLKDRILKIKNVSVGENTLLDGTIVNKANTGTKQAFKIETINKHKIISSDSHIFPIKMEKKGVYFNNKSSNFNKEYDLRVSDIIPLLEDNNVYLKVDINENKNRGYCYRDLVEYVIKSGRNEKFNILLDESTYEKYKNIIFEGRKVIPGYNRAIERAHKCSFQNLKSLINVDNSYLLEVISKSKEITILSGKSTATINLDENISDEVFKLLGLIYTDGSYDYKRNTIALYNKDNLILEWYLNTLHNLNLSKSNVISNGHSCGRIRHHNSALMNMFLTLIYDKNKKNIDLENMSRLSYVQFCEFFSGLIDGDGWVSKNNIGFCNFNGDDIIKIGELLSWNGVLFGYGKGTIHIHKKEINRKFIKQLKCVGAKNSKISNIEIFENKNTKAKLKNYIFYDNYYYVKIDNISKSTDELMYDIETTSHYFNTNYGIKTHNCNAFDFPYIVNRSKKINCYNYIKLSPVGKVYLTEKFNEQFKKPELSPVIAGVSCIDLLVLYKQMTKHLGQKESNKLDFIANEELEVGKVKLGDSGLGLADKDWDMFVLYNIIDANLTFLLDYMMGLCESLIATCAEARIPFEYFFTSKRVILGFFLTYMHRKGLVIPYLQDFVKEGYEGAYIRMNPKVWLDVVSFDAKEWYPSIARSANISPETKVLSKDKPLGNFSQSILEGVWYDNDKQGIIPELLTTIVKGRGEFKRLQKLHSDPESKQYDKDLSDYYKRKQNAYKIFANSVYGLLGNNHFQFYDIHNAATITGIGNKAIQHVISYLCKWIDIKLETNEQFKTEFGEYANVTIKGEIDEKYEKSFDENVRASLARQRRVVLAHTDSFFLTFNDIFAPFKNRERTFEEYLAVKNRFSSKESPDYNEAIAKYFEGMADKHFEKMTLTEFTLRLNHCVLDDVIGKITKKWAKDYNYREDHLWFKLEKCSEVLVAMSKAHYICYLQYDEGDLLINQKFKKRLKAVGVELVKSDTPKWSKMHIEEVLESLFKENNRTIIAKKIGMLKKDFMDPKNIHLISKPVSINSLGPTAANTYPAPRLGALKWNLLLEEDPDLKKYEPINEGTKVKWVYVKEPNKFNISAISYNNETFPPELLKYFSIDYETQWTKTFKAPLSTILDLYGWSNVFDGDTESIRRFFKPK